VEPKYTKGPWKAVKDDSHVSAFTQNWRAIKQAQPFNKHGGCRSVVGVDYFMRGDEVIPGVHISEADAQLIAAAPCLLEALEELVDLVQGVIDGDYKPDSFTLQTAERAIKKAIGET